MTRARVTFAWIMIWSGCSGSPVTGEPDPAACDGILQAAEGERIDSLFDRDHDGYLDAGDPGCADTYSVFVLDCDDEDASRHPDGVEVACNEVDDDCNGDTPDALDIDGDGALACDDCNDLDPSRSSAAPEVCWDLVDNDCDGIIDQQCGPNYGGSFALDQVIDYTCASTTVDLHFTEVGVLWNPPYAAIFPQTGVQPGNLEGEIAADGSFVIEGSTVSTSVGCDQYYRFSGNFTDDDHFVATFEAQFGNFGCRNCVDQTIPDLHGTRVD